MVASFPQLRRQLLASSGPAAHASNEAAVGGGRDRRAGNWYVAAGTSLARQKFRPTFAAVSAGGQACAESTCQEAD